MRKKWPRIAITVFLLAFLAIFSAGCWDVKELNRRGIADAVFFDTGDSTAFEMGVSLPTPGSQIPPIVGTTQQFEKRHSIITGGGESVTEAWTEVKSSSARDIFFGQVRAIIISEKAARGNLNDVLDFIGRLPLVPPNTNVLMTKEDPEKLLDIKNEGNFIPGDYIDFYFQIQDKKTLALPIDLWRVNSILDKKWQDPYLPIIEQKDDSYRISGTAVFSGSKMVGVLDKDETQTLALLKGGDVGYLTITMSNGEIVSFYKVKSKTIIDPGVISNGSVSFNIKSSISGGIVETQPRREITLDAMKKIEEEAKALTQRKIENLLVKLQGINSDPIGFGGKYRIENPEQWEKIDWHQVYPGVRYNIQTDFSVESTGLFR